MSADIQDEVMVVIAVFGSSGDVRENWLYSGQWSEPQRVVLAKSILTVILQTDIEKRRELLSGGQLVQWWVHNKYECRDAEDSEVGFLGEKKKKDMC